MTDLTVPESVAVPSAVSPALQIMLDDRLYERVKGFSMIMAKADGVTPKHLLGKGEACFAVITRALTWKLDPFAVAQATYQTPGGRIGYEGKLCHAIIQTSGRLEGALKYEHFGDWSRVQGRFTIKDGPKGKYPVPTWGQDDAEGLGVIVRAQVKGETEPRELSFELKQAFPLNSTLWATDPKTQICYTAVRRFGSLAAPDLFFGVPMDRDDLEPIHVGPERAKDITPPRPTRAAVEAELTRAEEAEVERRARQMAETGSTDDAAPEGEIEGADFDRPQHERKAQNIIDSLAEAVNKDDVEAMADIIPAMLEGMPADLATLVNHQLAARRAEIQGAAR